MRKTRLQQSDVDITPAMPNPPKLLSTWALPFIGQIDRTTHDQGSQIAPGRHPPSLIGRGAFHTREPHVIASPITSLEDQTIPAEHL